jgi:large subunit ribosomal protein L6
MSKVGNKPITINNGVNVVINEQTNLVTVKGKMGELSQTFDPRISIQVENSQVIVKRSSEMKVVKMLHGLTRSVIANMVEGVTNGYTKRLELKGVGYRVNLDKGNLILSLGFSHTIQIDGVEGLQYIVPADTIIEVKGINKELVGSVAAKIRRLRNPDPYKNKGVRYSNEVLIKKAGKALGKAGK